MRTLIKITVLMFLMAFISFSVPTSAQPGTANNASLVEIDLGITSSLYEWYENESGFNGDEVLFGAYVTLPVDSDLYIGLGSARPAEADGAYLARFDSTTITDTAKLDEQGFHEMIWDGTYVHIAGTDPTNGDGWEAGNHYIYNPTTSTLTKYRDPTNGLPNVLHSWGLWKAGSSDPLYAAVSSHDGTLINGGECLEYDNEGNLIANHCRGQIFSSLDNGATWTLLANLGGYRAYDFIGYQGDLYAIYNDLYTYPLSLTVSTDGGGSWEIVSNDDIELSENVRRTHMTIFNDKLIATSFDRASLYVIDDDSLSTHALPSGYLIGASYPNQPNYSDYNLLVPVDDYLYMIAENTSTTTNEFTVLRTKLSSENPTWELMITTDERLISMSYWAAHSWLVISSAGLNARLWQIDLRNDPTSVEINNLHANQSTPVSTIGIFLVFSASALGIISWALVRKLKYHYKLN